MTLAIIPALIVKGGIETFAIPQKNLVELVLVDEDQGDQIEKLHDSEFYRLRGDLIPIFRLKESLELVDEVESTGSYNIVVLQSEAGMYGLIVDEVLDTQEIVVKPLTNKLKIGGIYAGATIMGDGSVALIIDALGLFNKVSTTAVVDKEDFQSDGDEVLLKDTFDAEEILLFNLGDNREYGIPLCLVSRLEEFQQSKIEKSGKQSLIRYRDVAMPLIHLDDEVSYSSKEKLKLVSDDETVKDECPCIVSTIHGRNYGFIVDQILDIGKSEFPIDYTNKSIPGVMGTIYIHEKIVTIIDIHQVVESKGLIDKSARSLENKKAKILLVEDSVLYQRVIQETLENDGYEVVLAPDGSQGLELLKDESNTFDLMVSDVEMPQLNGFDLVSNLRSLENKHQAIPVVLVTTRISDDDLKKGKDVGADVHLKKLDKQEVLNTVNQMLA